MRTFTPSLLLLLAACGSGLATTDATMPTAGRPMRQGGSGETDGGAGTAPEPRAQDGGPIDPSDPPSSSDAGSPPPPPPAPPPPPPLAPIFPADSPWNTRVDS